MKNAVFALILVLFGCGYTSTQQPPLPSGTYAPKPEEWPDVDTLPGVGLPLPGGKVAAPKAGEPGGKAVAAPAATMVYEYKFFALNVESAMVPGNADKNTAIGLTMQLAEQNKDGWEYAGYTFHRMNTDTATTFAYMLWKRVKK